MKMMTYSIWIDFFLGSVLGSLRLAVMFVLMFLSTIIGLVVTSMTLYGEDNLQYTTFGLAFTHNFYDNITQSYLGEVFEPLDFALKLCNIFIYYTVMTYMLYAVFISIMHESYRNISIEKGDPQKKRTVSWRIQLKDLLTWTFAFLPEKRLKQLGQLDFFTVAEVKVKVKKRKSEVEVVDSQ